MNNLVKLLGGKFYLEEASLNGNATDTFTLPFTPSTVIFIGKTSVHYFCSARTENFFDNRTVYISYKSTGTSVGGVSDDIQINGTTITIKDLYHKGYGPVTGYLLAIE